MVGEGTMNAKLNQWYDSDVGKTRYRDECRRCGHGFHICDTPGAAHRSAARKGYNLETGLCKVCNLMANMAVLTAKRSGEAA